MATKKQPTKRTTSSRSTKQSAAEPAVPEPLPNHETLPGDSIADLAHRLFVERGGAHGHDLDDWLEAERRIRNGHA